ncbi:MAG: yutH [Bacillales bacterium]|jgi:spore coat protein YutH|nr:yutH [Bacillales bacterium]
MNERLINELYGLKVDQVLFGDKFTAAGYTFWLYHTEKSSEEEARERYILANHQHEQGEKGVWIPIQNRQGSFLSMIEGKKICLLGLGSVGESIVHELFGTKLAQFHNRGLRLQTKLEKVNMLGQWKGFWERRIDQLEQFWIEKSMFLPRNEFETIFVKVFPYYMGMTENAIQFLVDTEMDDKPQQLDRGTICFERYGQACYSSDSSRNPFHWVWDHPSRDLAEWVRDKFFMSPNTYHYEVRQFLQEYVQEMRPSLFSLRMLFARLLLPLQFFDTIEMFYLASSEGERKRLEDKLALDVKNAPQYEQFLRNFWISAEMPTVRQQIRLPEWLQ